MLTTINLYVTEFLKNPRLYCTPYSIVTVSPRGKHKRMYVELYCGFDIETYTVPNNHHAYMYIWQFSFFSKNGKYTIIGRTWYEFKQLIDCIKHTLSLSKVRRLIIGVANLSYEFQFLRHQYHWTKVFAKEMRQPLYVELDECIEFRDVLAISGGSLEQLAKDYTTTQKSHDLDYNIPRNKLTPITGKELEYCLNDVIIVAEFMEFLFNTYIKPMKWIPMTRTGILRHKVKKGCSYEIKLELYRCYPNTEEFYNTLMRDVFRGGYTHGNVTFMNQIIKDIDGYDITSSYPYVMLAYDHYPVSPFVSDNLDLFSDLIKTKCCIFHATFYDIIATTHHAIESSSKCLSISRNKVIDNGRIRHADYIDVWITDVDYLNYLEFYKWTDMEIHELYTAVRGRLPRYLLDPLATAYGDKSILKKQGQGGTSTYAIAKAVCNSAYGLTVQKNVIRDIVLDDNNEWAFDSSSYSFEKCREKAILLPQWGVYVTALARRRLLEMVSKIGNDVIYCDTDSIKCVGNHNALFEEENKRVRAIMKGICNLYNLDISLFDDLGTWEHEYKNVKGKFLGAKRYIITDETGRTTSTIAGLPKKALPSYCEANNIDIYDVFTDRMFMNMTISLKNANTYNDTPHTDIIDGVKMMELSSVGIYATEFTLKLDEFYKRLIDKILEGDEAYEHRVY